MRRTVPIFALTLGALALAGCSDPSGYNGGYAGGPQDNSRARTGAIAGALLGGVAGSRTRGDSRLLNAAVGAGLGAAVGGSIGTLLDRQAADLRSSVNNPNVAITNTGRELIVTLPQDILFATDSAAVRPDLQYDLQAVAGSLLRYPDSTIVIAGHTDNTGAAAYNQDLSQRRAQSVAFVLEGAGVPRGRIQAFGRGEDQPVASNLTPQGRAQNRRVEIVIRPNR